MSLEATGTRSNEKAKGFAGPNYQFSSIFGCIPLALSTLIIGICFLTHGIFIITLAYLDIMNADIIEVIGITLCTSFELLAGGASFFAVFRKSQAAISMMVIGYNVVIVNILVEFVTQWIEWLVEMNKSGPDQWKPEGRDVMYMTCYTAAILLLIVVSFFVVYGCLHSLKAVIAAGGTGWERKSYLDLFEEIEERAFTIAKQRLSDNPELCAALSEATGTYQTASIKMENYVTDGSNPIVHQALHDTFNQTFNNDSYNGWSSYTSNNSSLKRRTKSRKDRKVKSSQTLGTVLPVIPPDMSPGTSLDPSSLTKEDDLYLCN